MTDDLEVLPRQVPVLTQEELHYAAPGFYRIRSKDVMNRKTGETKRHGEIQWVQGQRYETDRVHVAHILPLHVCRYFIGYEGLQITAREDGYKIVDGWCRADRLDLEAGTCR